MPNGLIDIEKPFRLFDMRKFQQNVNRELRRTNPDKYRYVAGLFFCGIVKCPPGNYLVQSCSCEVLFLMKLDEESSPGCYPKPSVSSRAGHFRYF